MFALFPNSSEDLSVWELEDAFTVHFAIFEASFVYLIVFPNKFPVSTEQTILKLSSVSAVIGLYLAFSYLFVVHKLAREYFFGASIESTLSCHFPLFEGSFINLSVTPFENPFAFLQPINKSSFIRVAITEDLLPDSFWFILQPISFIHNSSDRHKGPLSSELRIGHISPVIRSIIKNKYTVTGLRFSFIEVAFEVMSIREVNFPLAMGYLVSPLTLIVQLFAVDEESWELNAFEFLEIEWLCI